MDDIIIDHWLGFTRSKNDLSPAYIDLLHNQKPQIKENKIIITARNSAEAAALFKRIEQPFKDHFETIGLGNMKLEVIVSTEIEEIENFKKKKIEEDRKIDKKTNSDKENRKKTKIKKNKIIIKARNSAEATELFKRIEQPFKDHFETIGLGNMKLEVIVSTEIEEIENFKKKTIEEDRKIAQKTYSDKEKREVSAKQNGTNKRLEIGYKI